MSKVITFSTSYPSHHTMKGKPTYFVEKIVHGLALLDEYEITEEQYSLCKCPFFLIPKWHTIRKGHRWKIGDKFSPRIWSGKPRQSKQIIIAPDIEIKKVWNFKIMPNGNVFISDKLLMLYPSEKLLYTIAMNDGLNLSTFLEWFQYPSEFDGQIICWNDEIDYSKNNI